MRGSRINSCYDGVFGAKLQVVFSKTIDFSIFYAKQWKIEADLCYFRISRNISKQTFDN